MDILYKYVKADRALACLPEIGDGALRATQPTALNDPFECAVRFFVAGDDGIDKEAELYRAYARGLTDINEASPVTPCMVSQAHEKYGSLYGRELTANQLSKRFGIVSFSADHRNLLMWSHYTTDGSGFVIGYDTRELQKLGGTTNRLRRVKYGTALFSVGVSLDETGEYPVPRRSDLPWAIPLSRKGKEWEYEQEWRLIVELNQTIGTGQTDVHGHPINLIRVPNEAVVSVYYTERTPCKTVDEVSKRLADPNNRYTAECPKKLILSPSCYAYIEENPS